MARFYSVETSGKLNASGRQAIEPHSYRAKLHRLRATIPFAGQAAGDDIVLGELPTGAIFAFGILNPSAGMGGTATIAIGTPGNTGKYRTAAIANAAGPVIFGNASAADDDPLTAHELVVATIAVAALPTSANFAVVDLFYSTQA